MAFPQVREFLAFVRKLHRRIQMCVTCLLVRA